MNVLYQELLKGSVNSKEISASLDNIFKIRAIQGFSPQEAIAFVFFLRKAGGALSERTKRKLRPKWSKGMPIKFIAGI